MAEHVHGCLNCRPDMVPDGWRGDPRYHDYEVCRVMLSATLDGVAPGYHKGVFEGPDGWVLLVCEGFDTERIHACPTCTRYVEIDGYLAVQQYQACLEPRFGRVEVAHACPVRRYRGET